jgi:hypothetical protein
LERSLAIDCTQKKQMPAGGAVLTSKISFSCFALSSCNVVFAWYAAVRVSFFAATSFSFACAIHSVAGHAMRTERCEDRTLRVGRNAKKQRPGPRGLLTRINAISLSISLISLLASRVPRCPAPWPSEYQDSMAKIPALSTALVPDINCTVARRSQGFPYG